jgi:hypothetical protein
MRVIGIAGAPYCGSTLLDRCLAGLPGVVALGETRWILDAGAGPWTHLGICGAHGSTCWIFTPEALARLRAGEEREWWPRLGDLVHAQTLVSADKSPEAWLRLGLPDFLLVPYRDPADMVRSYREAECAGRWGNVDLGTAEIARVWAWVQRSGVPFLPVDLDALADDPALRLRRLVAETGLMWSDAALRPWEATGCVFGGNSARLVGFGRAFRRSAPTQQDEDAVARVRDALALLLGAA